MDRARRTRANAALLALAGWWGTTALLEAADRRAVAAEAPLRRARAATRASADRRLVPRDLRSVRGIGGRRALDLARYFRVAGVDGDPTRLYGIGPRTRAALDRALPIVSPTPSPGASPPAGSDPAR